MLTELFLAGRYLRPKRNAVSLITFSSILGVTLGVAVLMVVLAVMTGFTDLMKEKLVETQAHFQIRDSWNRGIADPEKAVSIVRAAGADASPVVLSPVLVQSGRHLDTQSILFGANEEDLRRRLNLEDGILEGRLSLGRGEVIISSYMAARWRVGVGSKVLLHSAQRLTGLVHFKPDGSMEVNPDTSAYLPAEFTVTGIYSVGKSDFDRRIFFAGIDDAAELLDLPWGAATAIYCWGPDAFDQKDLVEKIRAELPGTLRLTTWQEENQQLLGVLAVEKRMMFFLLIFIVLVAAFSITNTLITSVYQKTREIGVLKALGASDGAVTMIFVLQGFLIGVLGSGCGTLLGFLVIHFRNDIMHKVSEWTGQELFPKEFYFFNELPAHIVTGDVLFIVLSSVILCTLGALLPALRAARLDPAKALRYE